MSNVTVNGVANGNTDFSLDGIANMTKARVSFAPPGDMVQEFRVETVNYDASMGHAAGGSVNMSLKAGTNALHGTAEWLVAPNPWQANDFFTNKQLYDISTGPVTPEKIARLVAPRKVNRYSATVGGPVYLPRIYDGRNRTFWTYAFQGFNRRNPNTDYYTLPTAAERDGDFSALLQIPRTGSQYQIYDPATIATAPNGRTSRQIFPNNIIPKSRFDATAQKYLQYFPLPNAAGTVDGLNNWNEISANSNDFIQHMSRVDHSFSERHRIFGRVTYSWLHFYRGDFLGNGVRGLDRLPQAARRRLRRCLHHLADHDRQLQVRLHPLPGIRLPLYPGFDLASLGFPSSLISQIDPQAVRFPAITIDSIIQLGETTNSQYVTNYHNFSASLSKMQGNHSMRLGRRIPPHGGEQRRLRPRHSHHRLLHQLDPRPARQLRRLAGRHRPGLRFLPARVCPPAAASTRTPPTPTSPPSPVCSCRTTGKSPAASLSTSVCAGNTTPLRWSATTAPCAALTAPWPVPSPPAPWPPTPPRPTPPCPSPSSAPWECSTFTGLNGQPRGFWNTGKKNFAPRVGLAYQLAPKMVLRAGYGIFYASNGVDQNAAIQAGFSQATNLIPSDNNGLSFRATLANPFPDGVLLPSAVGPSTYLGRAITFSDDFVPNSYAQRWSFGIQRQLPARSLLEVSYVGNRSTRISINRELDFTPRRLPQHLVRTRPADHRLSQRPGEESRSTASPNSPAAASPAPRCPAGTCSAPIPTTTA